MQEIIHNPLVQIVGACILFGLFLAAVYHWDMRRSERRVMKRTRDALEIALIDTTADLLEWAVAKNTLCRGGPTDWPAVQVYLEQHILKIANTMSKLEQQHQCHVRVKYFTHDHQITFTFEGYYSTYERTRTLSLLPVQKVA